MSVDGAAGPKVRATPPVALSLAGVRSMTMAMFYRSPSRVNFRGVDVSWSLARRGSVLGADRRLCLVHDRLRSQGPPASRCAYAATLTWNPTGCKFIIHQQVFYTRTLGIEAKVPWSRRTWSTGLADAFLCWTASEVHALDAAGESHDLAEFACQQVSPFYV